MLPRTKADVECTAALPLAERLAISAPYSELYTRRRAAKRPSCALCDELLARPLLYWGGYVDIRVMRGDYIEVLSSFIFLVRGTSFWLVGRRRY